GHREEPKSGAHKEAEPTKWDTKTQILTTQPKSQKIHKRTTTLPDMQSPLRRSINKNKSNN
ncbi:hypothetical protein, partial [Pseudochrobactrum kiredjianiae]